MSNLQPPPTFANPVDQKTGTFSPVWLQWFIDYANSSNSNSTQTSTIVSEIATLNSQVSTLQSDMTAALNFTQGFTHAVSTQAVSTSGTYTNGTSYNVQAIVPTANLSQMVLSRASSPYATLTAFPTGFAQVIVSPSDSVAVTYSTSGTVNLTLVPV